jgi:tRNA pseudouridine32 synthase/23S rRNA pseudouridine746 synthase
MNNQYLFNFKTDISGIPIPEKLNNPFVVAISEIAKIAVQEFQEFMSLEVLNWDYDFETRPGKMFGVLVVQKQDNSYAYLGTSSGVLSRKKTCERFTPPVFDESTDDYFINRDMTEITKIGTQIKNAKSQAEAKAFKELRSQKSKAVQKKLFEHYVFLNIHGKVQNVLQIFENSDHGNPPASTGECAAPKLLQYAFKNSLKPIALAEFWWGNSLKGTERNHKVFYPSCKNKCRPILAFMLDEQSLYSSL